MMAERKIIIFLKYKLENLVDQINDNIDIFMNSETKLDGSFPVSQFLIKRYSSPL